MAIKIEATARLNIVAGFQNEEKKKQLREQIKEVSKQIDEIGLEGGTVSRTDPLTVKLKHLRDALKKFK